jgi:hypothetical protein
MRWATYQRLEEQYDRLQDRWGVTVVARFGRHFARWGVEFLINPQITPRIP